MENIGDISSIINKIIADPSFAEMVGRVKGDDGDKSAEEIKADMTSRLPDVMAMVAPMLGGLGGGDSGEKESETEKKDSYADKKDSESASDKHKNSIVPKKYDKAHAEKLLYAIKPYLSKNRCEIIDKCVSVMQLTDVVSAFGGLESLLKIGEK